MAGIRSAVGSGCASGPPAACHDAGNGLASKSAGASPRIKQHLKSEPAISTTDMQADASALCQSCGACCSFSREWPRFSTEEDAELERIPIAFVDQGQGRMRCNGNRCSALVGDVGVATSCVVYAVRPQVCRTCQPGDDECGMARHRFGLPPILR